MLQPLYVFFDSHHFMNIVVNYNNGIGAFKFCMENNWFSQGLLVEFVPACCVILDVVVPDKNRVAQLIANLAASPSGR